MCQVAFYKAKQLKRTGSEINFVEAIRISPAEEMAIFWNNHGRINASIAQSHIDEWTALTPRVTSHNEPADPMPAPAGFVPDLDSQEELAVRSLLLGIDYRTAGYFGESQIFLLDAVARQGYLNVNTWVGSVANFELAVLGLKACERKEREDQLDREADRRKAWSEAIKAAEKRIEEALSLSSSTVDLSSRLDSRINMLKGEIALKKEKLGIA